MLRTQREYPGRGLPREQWGGAQRRERGGARWEASGKRRGPSFREGHRGRVGARGKARGRLTSARAWRWMESRHFAPPQSVLLPRAPDSPTPAPCAARAGRRGALLGFRTEESGQLPCPPPHQCF